MKKIFTSTRLSLSIILIITLSACEDFVTLDPPQTTLSTATVFKDEATAKSAVNRIYIDMVQYSESFFAGTTSLNNMGGLSADELDNYSSFNELAPFAANEVTPLNPNLMSKWNNIYNLIYQTNAVMRGLSESTAIDELSKNQLLGEALFMRAYFHLLLVSFWGDVPWVTSTDYLINAKLSRSPAIEVYQNIIEDLVEAKNLLPAEAPQHIRPTKVAASALLARVYLYTQNYGAAEAEASLVMVQVQLEEDLSSVFLIESAEIIFQLQSITPRINTWDGNSYVLISAPQDLALKVSFIQAFEPGDLRQQAWTNSFTDGVEIWYYPFKYKVRTLPDANSSKTEFQVLLRASEMYLIRAEARANLDNIAGASEDLNAIRTRAGLPVTNATDKNSMLLAIEHERRFELFTENGHRWLDLKRTNRLDAVIGSLKPGWQPTDALFPIPQFERNRNSNISQNPGY
ncbi:MAG TPA: RagB/SusD family nutrient uptake outer membrane protein [Cyclobacteriaceae bacterium]|nr:RagB/SusD family nutrient uptake outer membrane protein [Cyclobacteriaceae bacterium]